MCRKHHIRYMLAEGSEAPCVRKILNTVLGLRPSKVLEVLITDMFVEYIEIESDTAAWSRSTESLTEVPTGPRRSVAICSNDVSPARFAQGDTN